MHLIEVRFKGNRKEFFHWAGDEPPAHRAPVIVDADRGEDLGVVESTGELAQRRFAGTSHGQLAGPVSRQALRLATAEEYEGEHQLRHHDDEIARRQAMERVKAHGLTMKVTDAEWQWDRKKLTLYFTAERRVDFRALVRDLASAFRARIELKQIGVRDEARRLDGIGRCGRQYCSASWLPELRPVNLGVAKDQGLSLNPLQISGACGRLMCCLRYEHEFYVQSRKRFPKEGRILVTARGEEKVVSNDIFNDRVTLRNVEGDVRVAELAELRAEMAARSDVDVASRDASADLAGNAASDDARARLDRHDGDDRTGGRAHGDGEPDADGSAPGARSDRAPRPRRALPMRDQTPRPRSTRPTGRVRPATEPPEAEPAGGTTVADAVDRHDASPATGLPPRAGVEPGDAAGATDVGGPTGHAEATPAATSAGGDATGDVGRGVAGDDEGGDDADDGADDTSDDASDGASTDETRRRRRRGRRGGRRGRAGRGDGGESVVEQATDSGAPTRTGSDHQGG
ncbi:MAG: PSP1 domain-containing protein [Gemmatimonadaceae bacterium]